MIYDLVAPEEPIRQGDLFHGVPRVEIALDQMPVFDQYGELSVRSWRDVAENGRVVTAILPLRPVIAIVATQDCDAARSADITLCEVRPFREVDRIAEKTSSSKSWVRILTQHARINLKWFYLPPDERASLGDKMAADFTVTLRVPRVELEAFRDRRRVRLNAVAREHFRERIGEFFRRFAYDEWYALDKDELAAYRREYPEAKPFPWQATAPETTESREA